MQDELFMRRCLDLAKRGAGFVAPNPMVGSVIVLDNKIIGEGFHKEYGQAHAEVNAVHSVQDKSTLKASTIYINLEPCAHFGKTPPCADLIVEHQIKRVVIGCIDSYSEVAGKGIEKLEKAGIEVTVGVLEKESLNLNRRFFTFHNKKRPYIILKWAQSADGFLDKVRAPGENGINWITQPATKQLVHKWRHEEAAILVGKNTVVNDNPNLTCRDYPGKNPTRLVIDAKNELNLDNFNIGSTEAPTIKLTGNQLEIGDILKVLHEANLQSVIIEGGAFTINKFLDAGIWDEARVLHGTPFFKSGLNAPKIENIPAEITVLGKDKLYTYIND
ncbi:MAG: bifunctional diaminohydroxyphosphoribosylaminopyrimidine deaminase/5-amino-6-(5-phosphoribosylamino)uracil reductase RibD [Crocinitomicaceae bacterium]